MEVAEKRKRLEEGEVDGKRVKGSKTEGKEKKTKVHYEDDDGEVEEFFAILRRIHVAVKYFQKGPGGGGGGGDGRLTMGRLWNPNFEREDFEGIKVEKGSETVDDNAGLDLNADPDTK